VALPEGPGSWSFARSGFLDPLVRPDDFFARDGSDRRLSPSRFVLAAYVALVVAIVGSGMAAIAVLFPERFTPSAVARLLPKLLGLVALAGISLLLAWFLFGALLHVASRLAGGSGAFSNAVAAYGLGPIVVISGCLLVLAVGYTLTPLAPDFQTIEAYRDFLDRTESGVEPYSTLLTALWQWYVWTFGLKHARDLSTSRAAIAAGTVALGILLWTVV
jgi:hypothetical protein